jgi:uncharacterized protein
VPGGGYDHYAVEERPDVSVYGTPPRPQAVAVAGPIMATLRVVSSAVNTDFAANFP